MSALSFLTPMKNPFHKLVRPSSKKSNLRSKRKLRSIITPNVSKKLKADETNATTWSDEVEGDAPAPESISTTSVGEEAESVGISETDLYERLIRAEARVQAFEQQSNFQATQATGTPLVMKPSPPRFDQISPSSDGRTDYSKLRAAVEALQATLEKAPTEPIPADWKASILQASSSTERDRFRSFLAKEVTWAYAIDYI